MNDVYTFINLLYNCKCSEHNRDIIITTIRLKSPASLMFTQSFIQTQIKENIKAPRRWPLCGEFTFEPCIPA